jgi:polysaccharide biosynthesis/export protein
MLKVILIAAAAALLSGCAVSSLSDADANSNIASETTRETQDVTGSVKPTSADALAEDISPPRAKARSDSSDPGSFSASVAKITAVSVPGSAAYKIGPQDILDISVFKVPELSKSAQVSERGTFSYPLVGDIVAVGKTPREVQDELTGLLRAKYLQNPDVTVFVKEFNSQRVTIDGAVKKPGVYPIQSGLSLQMAITLAQGLDTASDDTIVVFRSVGGKRTAARFDISDIRSGEAEDPQLQAGDVVVAGTSALKKGFDNFLRALPVAGMFALL